MNLADLYFSYSGRINRGKFWLGYLGAAAATWSLFFLSTYLFGPPFFDVTPEEIERFGVNAMLGSTPALVSYAAVLIGSMILIIPLFIKRCHDRGKSGWWLLLSLIPIAGLIWLIIDLGVMEGDEGPNAYGPNPLKV